MAASKQEEETFIKARLAEFQQQKLATERDLQSNNDFLKQALVSSRYPEVGAHFQAGDFPKVMGALTPEEQEHLAVLKQAYHPTMSRLILAPGQSTSGLGGFSMSFHHGKGRLHPVGVVDSKAPFAFTIMLGVSNDDLKGCDSGQLRRAVREKTIAYLSTLSHESPSIATHFAEGSDHDAAPWKTFFPSTKSYAGVYVQEDNLFLVASTHAGETIRSELNDLFVGQEVFSSQFTQSQLATWIKGVSRRNCERVLYGLASVLGFIVPFREDFNAAVPRHHIPPRCIIPEITTAHNTCNTSDIKHATFFHRCADGSQSKGGIIVRSDLVRGLALLQPSFSGANEAGGMFPITTGSIPRDSRVDFSRDDRKRYSRRVHYLRSSDSYDGDEGDFSRSTRKLRGFRHHPFEKTSYSHVKDVMGVPESFSEHYDPIFVCSS